MQLSGQLGHLPPHSLHLAAVGLPGTVELFPELWEESGDGAWRASIGGCFTRNNVRRSRALSDLFCFRNSGVASCLATPSTLLLQPEQINKYARSQTMLISRMEYKQKCRAHTIRRSPVGERCQLGLELSLARFGAAEPGCSLLQILTEGFHACAAPSRQAVLQRAEEMRSVLH